MDPFLILFLFYFVQGTSPDLAVRHRPLSGAARRLQLNFVSIFLLGKFASSSSLFWYRPWADWWPEPLYRWTPAKSGHGATALSPRPASGIAEPLHHLILAVGFKIYGHQWPIPFRPGKLLMSPSLFLESNLQSLRVIQKYAFFFRKRKFCRFKWKPCFKCFKVLFQTLDAYKMLILTPIWPVQVALGSYSRALHVSATV
jgi:hypothetical protein